MVASEPLNEVQELFALARLIVSHHPCNCMESRTVYNDTSKSEDSIVVLTTQPELKPLVHRGETIPGYFAGKDGSIWSGKSANLRKLKDYPVGKNYEYRGVAIRLNGATVRANVHSLIAEAFIGPRPDGMQVRHGDGNGHNNHVLNLCYGTQIENEADKLQHGTHQHGERNPSAKLSNEDAGEIRRLRSEGVSLKVIADQFGVRESTVSRIANGVRRAGIA